MDSNVVAQCSTEGKNTNKTITSSNSNSAATDLVSGTSMSREQLVRAIFRSLDTSYSGRVNIEAMRRFATLNGFEGSDREWREEYTSMCGEWQIKPSDGFSEDTFTRLVNDRSQKGCYCNDQELKEIFQKLIPAPAAQPLSRSDRSRSRSQRRQPEHAMVGINEKEAKQSTT